MRPIKFTGRQFAFSMEVDFPVRFSPDTVPFRSGQQLSAQDRRFCFGRLARIGDSDGGLPPPSNAASNRRQQRRPGT
jgi:hypothetical protein